MATERSIDIFLIFFKTLYVHVRFHYTGVYGTPSVTQTDAGSGQLIVSPRPTANYITGLGMMWIFRGPLKLIGKVIKETFYAVHPVIRVVCLLILLQS